MRADLESAMAAVITSPTARISFVTDPEEFGRGFALSPAEVDALLEMEEDLISLTGSFVVKRSATLRWNAQRTLALLGPKGNDILADFVDSHPMTDSFRAEATAFNDYVVERCRGLLDGSVRSRVVVEMARFEQHRSRAFWGSTAPSGAAQGGGGGPSAPSGEVRLRPGANVGAFEWDMRMYRWMRVAPLTTLHPDPCHLLFFHTGGPLGLRVQRVRPAEAHVLEVVAQAGRTTHGRVIAAVGHDVDAAAVLREFSGRGLLQWV